jgi:acetoin utilization deacetylase AcuC-like enzyme
VTVFFNEESYGHIQDPFHPESPDRLRGIVQGLKRHGLWDDVMASKTGKIENLLPVHDEDYIDFLRTCGECSLTMDTLVHKETFEIAALSAECGIDATVYSKMNGKPTFALTRPPGHHAGRNYGMGFCYLNNIAIAANHLLSSGDERIAIVDADVHHGNGTEQIFAHRKDVLYISTHQTGIFPGTGNVDFVGKGEGVGYTLNMPFASGCGDSTYDTAHSNLIEPVLRQFEPDAILVSFGVDGHYRDPLASLSLSSDGHLRVARNLMRAAERCENRVTFMLEGGYDVPALTEVVCAIVGEMRGVEVKLEYNDILDNSCLGRGVIERCMRNASEYWDL